MAAKTDSARRRSSTLAALTRHRGPDAPDVLKLRAELRVARLEEHIRKVVEAAPPLSDEQRSKLASLLSQPPTVGGVGSIPGLPDGPDS